MRVDAGDTTVDRTNDPHRARRPFVITHWRLFGLFDVDQCGRVGTRGQGRWSSSGRFPCLLVRRWCLRSSCVPKPRCSCSATGLRRAGWTRPNAPSRGEGRCALAVFTTRKRVPVCVREARAAPSVAGSTATRGRCRRSHDGCFVPFSAVGRSCGSYSTAPGDVGLRHAHADSLCASSRRRSARTPSMRSMCASSSRLAWSHVVTCGARRRKRFGRATGNLLKIRSLPSHADAWTRVRSRHHGWPRPTRPAIYTIQIRRET